MVQSAVSVPYQNSYGEQAPLAAERRTRGQLVQSWQQLASAKTPVRPSGDRQCFPLESFLFLGSIPVKNCQRLNYL